MVCYRAGAIDLRPNVSTMYVHFLLASRHDIMAFAILANHLKSTVAVPNSYIAECVANYNAPRALPNLNSKFDSSYNCFVGNGKTAFSGNGIL